MTSDPDRRACHASPQVAVQDDDAESQPLRRRFDRLAGGRPRSLAARRGRPGQQQESEGGD